MDLIKQGLSIAQDPKYSRWICPLLLLADGALCSLVIWKVPYTEIDWKAYMEQVAQYIDGERDYTQIKGGTGPLVYPGLHVYIYRLLYGLTGQGRDIFSAQLIFAVLYLGTLAVVMACYRRAKVPPYVFPMLILSKRLHSIFVLRCFNDCFAVAFFFLAIYAYQNRMWTAGSMLYSCAVGVKMSALLALPAVGFVLLQGIGQERALTQAGLIGQLQLLFGVAFLRSNAIGYLSRAFELTRVFLYKWTVNWRFLSEETFLSKNFSIFLLSVHALLLLLFASTRWNKPAQRTLPEIVSLIFKVPADQELIAKRVNPRFTMATILSAIAVGMLCARSLHYQFYSWIAWATPFLLWQAGFHPILQYALWAAQEWAWNVFPSTPASSAVAVGVLAVQVAGVWWGMKKEGKNTKQKAHSE
ncbi:glycosyltransferase family 58 protein [Aplosporella prunicola CBS 121167]|uniref:Dol-P-Man:Man(5)GlcNAc(2)-PP-Dol alpha-1,3-mannosyltransferase n=1 Tax=Aplosporella prunicola CBS 121167 TaxID=1176127 RepID=A0A6A6BKA4_9PEZI|nr:glycosyltransferase family 58 protein [Aplosporella prunicola CBS 121167]KAF2143765.1 glycosyltransferase family 58 protein [Aplosporella prunicola CBS 121167]